MGKATSISLYALKIEIIKLLHRIQVVVLTELELLLLMKADLKRLGGMVQEN